MICRDELGDELQFRLIFWDDISSTPVIGRDTHERKWGGSNDSGSFACGDDSGCVCCAVRNVDGRPANIVTTARETWMREFREQVVGLIISTAALESHQIALVRGEASLSEKEKRRAEITKEMMQHYQTLVLLIAEKGPQYDWFIEKMQNRMRAEQPESVNASRARAEFTKGAEGVLKAERAAIEKPELRCILRTSFWLKSLTR